MRIPSPRPPRAAAALAVFVVLLLAVAAVSAKSRAQTLEIARDGTVVLSPGATLLDRDARPVDPSAARADPFGLPGDRFLVGRTAFGPSIRTADPNGSLRLRGRTRAGVGVAPALRPGFDAADPTGAPGVVFRRLLDDAVVLRDAVGRPTGLLEVRRDGDLVVRGRGGAGPPAR